MQHQPTIAVLLATYNGKKFIKQQLDSILAQTYANIVIYISDDNSSDDTFSILQSYQEQYSNKINLFRNEQNIGCVKNFEKLLKIATEEYSALCDQDDIWLDNKLELQINALLKSELKYGKHLPCMVHSDLKMINENNIIIRDSFFNYRKISLSKDRLVNKIISHNGVMGCTTLMNKALLESILPFPERLDVHDYWIAVVNEIIGKRITITEALVLYRIHNSNVSNTITKINVQRTLLQRFFNNDKLPFIGLNREKILRYVLQHYSNKLNDKDRNMLMSFIDYLENNKNSVKIFYELIKYNLIREDLSYRLKIFIKLMQRNIN